MHFNTVEEELYFKILHDFKMKVQLEKNYNLYL